MGVGCRCLLQGIFQTQGLIGVAFQAPPGSQASSRGEAKDSALLSSRDAGLLAKPFWGLIFSVHDLELGSPRWGSDSFFLGKGCHPRASSAKTRGFHTQLDEGPETP